MDFIALKLTLCPSLCLHQEVKVAVGEGGAKEGAACSEEEEVEIAGEDGVTWGWTTTTTETWTMG